MTIPEGVTTIGGSAFESCTSLTSITIPSTVINASGSFYNCSGLSSIVVEVGNSVYDSRNNCNAIIRTSDNTLQTGCKNTVIPSTVAVIGLSAFKNCTGLTSITIPEGVTTIDPWSFEGCTGLTSLTIPSSVTDIYNSAFGGCTELADVYCYAEVIPNTVTNAFEGSYIEYSTLHVPASAIESYRTTEPWSEFGTIVALDEQVPMIGEETVDEVRQKLADLKDYIDSFFEAFQQKHALVANQESGFYGIHSTLNTCIGIFEKNLTAYEGGESSLAGSLLTQWNVLQEVRGLLGESNYILDVSVTARGGGSVIVGGTYVSNETKNLTWLYSKYTIPLNEYANHLETAFGHSFYIKSYDGDISIRPNQGYHVSLITKNGKEYDNPASIFAEGEIVVEFSPDEQQQCAKPTIGYKNGQLTFKSATEGVEFKYEITDTDVKSGSGSVVNLTVTYTIRVRAVKDGYGDSEEAIATLCWIEVEPKKEGITDDEDPIVTGVKEQKAIPVLIQTENGNVIVTGVADEALISVYGVNGMKVGAVVSHDGHAIVNTNLTSGSIAIVKIGERSVKVVMK